jgi:hypothetical protein
MDVHPTLCPAIFLEAHRCTCDNALPGNDRAHHLENFEQTLGTQWLGCTPIKVDEKAKHVRFLFDDVHLFMSPYQGEILYEEGVRVFGWYIEYAAIHEIVGPGTIRNSPLVEEPHP